MHLDGRAAAPLTASPPAGRQLAEQAAQTPAPRRTVVHCGGGGGGGDDTHRAPRAINGEPDRRLSKTWCPALRLSSSIAKRPISTWVSDSVHHCSKPET